ncbi:MAG TPA: aminoglycoside phosphotransferase family protein [Dehalococcoidia bacterium]|nr:aminoglycoside phosphotransferase family protein [Dehalococcoidia bacterium]
MDATGSIKELRKLAEGRGAEIFAWDEGSVLRLFRDAHSSEAVDREMAVMRAVSDVVPFVPAVLGRAEVDGRPGIILERIDGSDLLTQLETRPWTVRSVGAICGTLHARLHEVTAPPVLPALVEVAPTLLDRLPQDVAVLARRALASLPVGDRLCHGDFHPANVLNSSRGPVVIDWPNAVRGDPHADVARTLMLLRLGALPPGTSIVVRVGAAVARRLVASSYRRAYARTRALDDDLVRRWAVVVAALRLLEDLPGERPALLRLVRTAAAEP